MPQWYSDYSMGILAKANAVAAEPYQAYQGPRVADFTPDQQSSFDQVRQDQGAYQPTLDSGTQALQQSAGMSPITAAQPYLNNAAQTSTANIGQYMNPYTDQVTNRIGDLAARNLNEKLMPAIGDQFTQAGQYGSSRMQEATGRALRDTQESALAAQSSALQQGYGQALTASNADLTRQGQIGQTAGNLTSAGQQNLNSAGVDLGNIAAQGQGMQLKDTAALSGIGGQQQQLDQTNLNTAYGDFQNQVAYPQQQVGFLNNALHGIAAPTSTSTSTTGPAASYSASPLASLTGGLAGISSLFKKDGGYVDKKAPRHRAPLSYARA